MSSVKVTLQGMDELVARMRVYGIEADRIMAAELKRAAQDARSEAVRGIQRGPATGRIYPPVRGRRQTPHQASAPGQFPQTDTGRLAASVRVERDHTAAQLTYVVGTALEYGAHLEFGTLEMRPRPWLQPSVDAAVPRFMARLRRGLERLRGR